MKPPEILGMIEEAAGTRMFENKKQAALKTIGKKEAKVCMSNPSTTIPHVNPPSPPTKHTHTQTPLPPSNYSLSLFTFTFNITPTPTTNDKKIKMEEMKKILSDEITPTLNRLRAERKFFLEWQANSAEVERLERFSAAYQFSRAQESLAQSEGDLVGMETSRNSLREEVAKCRSVARDKSVEAEGLRKLATGDYEKALSTAKSREEASSKDLVKATTVLRNKRAVLDKEEKAAKTIEGQTGESEEAARAKEEEIAAARVELDKAQAVVKVRAEEMAAATQAYQEMCAGITSSISSSSGSSGEKERVGDGGTLEDQIASTAQVAQSSRSEMGQWHLKASHLEVAIREGKKEASKSDKEFKKMEKEKQVLMTSVNELERRLASLLSGQSLGGTEQLVAQMSEEVERLQVQLRTEEAALEKVKQVGFGCLSVLNIGFRRY